MISCLSVNLVAGFRVKGKRRLQNMPLFTAAFALWWTVVKPELILVYCEVLLV